MRGNNSTFAYELTGSTSSNGKYLVTYSRTASIVDNNNYYKGSTSYGTVTSTNRNSYPTNGRSGSYWYVSAGSTSQTLDEPGTLSGTVVADYGTYPENGKSGNYWYIRK